MLRYKLMFYDDSTGELHISGDSALLASLLDRIDGEMRNTFNVDETSIIKDKFSIFTGSSKQ